MKLELNVKRFNNEDVIATSCATVKVYEIYDGHVYDVSDPSETDIATTTFPGVNVSSLDGFYHFEGDKFVVCPIWNGDHDDPNIDDIFAAHGLDK